MKSRSSKGDRKQFSGRLGILMELPVIHVYQGEWSFHEALKFMAGPVLFLRKFSPWVITARTMFRPSNSIACSVRLANRQMRRSAREEIEMGAD